MRADTLLTRYRGGHLEVANDGLTTPGGDLLTTPGGDWLDEPGSDARIEGFVNYPEDSLTEAERKALATIDELAEPRWQSRVGVEPTGTGDVPFTDWGVGDTITVPDQDASPAVARVIGLTVSEDEAGHAIYQPQVGAFVESLEERQAVVNRTMSAGTLGGRDPQAMPRSGGGGASSASAATAPRATLPPWSLRGVAQTQESGRFYPQAVTILSVRASLRVAGSSTTTVAIKVDGTSQDTISLGSGTNTDTKSVSITVASGSYLTLEVTAAGTDAEDLTVQLS